MTKENIHESLPSLLSSCFINITHCFPKECERNPMRRIFKSCNIQYKRHVPSSMITANRWKMTSSCLPTIFMDIFINCFTCKIVSQNWYYYSATSDTESSTKNLIILVYDTTNFKMVNNISQCSCKIQVNNAWSNSQFKNLLLTKRQALRYRENKMMNRIKRGCIAHLLESWSIIWWDHMTVIRNGTFHDIFTEFIDRALICTKRFNFCSSTVRQTYELPKWDACSFDLF